MKTRYRSSRQALPPVLAVLVLVSAATVSPGSDAQPKPSPPKACGTKVATAKLLDSFYSCAPVEDVRKKIVSRGLHWQPMPDTATTRTQLHMVRVAGFAHLGATGELRLLFYRDRLMQMQFAPVDLREFWERLVRTKGLQVVTANNESVVTRARIGTRVDVWLNTDAGYRYVGWRDERLEREFGAKND